MDGYTMGGATSRSHLLFTNDSLFFAKANKKSITTIKEDLQNFLDYLRLQVNPTKSYIIFLVLTTSMFELVELLGFPVKILPFTHLGTPLIGRDICASDYHTLTYQLRLSFATWRMKTLSHVGKIQLTKWTIHGCLNYWFPWVLLSKGALYEARKITYGFIWNGRKGVSWRQMTKAREHGVLGLKDNLHMDL